MRHLCLWFAVLTVLVPCALNGGEPTAALADAQRTYTVEEASKIG